MMIDEFEMGNSTSSQEREMEEGRNLIEEFKTPSPERVLNGNENTNTEEEITDLRKTVTFFYNHNDQWTNSDIEVDYWSRIEAKTRYIQIIKHLW